MTMDQHDSSIPSLDAAGAPEVSVVFPCLNEQRTIAECVRQALAAMAGAGLRGEVIVADNGSTDPSAALAAEAGAVVVPVRGRGYGITLRTGIAAARAPHIVFLDADLSYDPAYIPKFVEALRGGADFVMGSRIRGGIDPGAMPPLHRYFGTPMLTLLADLLFHARITDINCGMRGISRTAMDRMHLYADGMEFASEMIIQATHHRLRIVEVPIHFHCDQRGREPHLRSFRDGWRHLQLMLHFAPPLLFLGPGAMMVLAGLAAIWWVLPVAGPVPGVLAALAGLLATDVGVQVVLLGLTSMDRIGHPRWHDNAFLGKFAGHLRWVMMLENGVALSVTAFLSGLALLAWAVRGSHDASGYDAGALRLAFLGASIAIAGLQVFFTCAFLGLFGRKASDAHTLYEDRDDEGPDA
jgi:hypothetical protein